MGALYSKLKVKSRQKFDDGRIPVRLPENRLSDKRLSVMRKLPAGDNHKERAQTYASPDHSVRPRYPFSAISGQDDLKLALILNAVDPLIGGVLAMGHRGTAKSTAVRGLSDLVPEIKIVSDCVFQCDPKDLQNICARCLSRLQGGEKLPTRMQSVQVVELPLGATEDRVCGTVNIERALKEGTTVLEPGLLARANRGFLYIDEVNLLEDHLVDLLLDVAASGINRVEREGVSVEHPARFVLIGSGNPEEGELRPQLLDRFGLHVEVMTEANTHARATIVELRDAFDRDPVKFNERFAEEQTQLREKIVRARRSLSKTKMDRALLLKAARLCSELGVEGHRGELTLVRAARARAAFEGRAKVSEDDLRRVASMALRHRLRQHAFEDGSANARVQESLDQIDSDSPSKASESRKGYEDGSGRSSAVESVAAPAKAATNIRLPDANTSLLRSTTGSKSSGKKKRHVSESAGRHVRSVGFKTATRKIAIAATIRALLTSAAGLSSETLRFKLFSRKHGALFVFLIDTSGSMARHRIAIAKRAILDLLRQSYLNRDTVAIVTFRGADASVALTPSRSILRARRSIDSLSVGGSTPLSAGLLCASELIRRSADKQSQKWVVVFTDGRANVPLRSSAMDDREAVIAAELKQLGLSLSKSRVNVVVADTQRQFERNDDPKRLAHMLGGQLIHVSETV